MMWSRHCSTLSGKEYTIESNTTTAITLHEKYGDNVSTSMNSLGAATYDIIQSHGNIVWWGHNAHTSGNPTAQSTRLGRALYEMWEQLKVNQQGGSGAALGYADVGYWDYEYTSATHLYIFGHSCGASSGGCSSYYYATIPSGIVAYSAVLSHAGKTDGDYDGWLEYVKKYHYHSPKDSQEGFVQCDVTSVFASNYGLQKTMRHYAPGGWTYINQAIILLTSG